MKTWYNVGKRKISADLIVFWWSMFYTAYIGVKFLI